MVGWANRKEGPYRMCEMCADHNVRNRGAEILGKVDYAMQAKKHIDTEALVRRYFELDDHLTRENKRYGDYIKPFKDEMEKLKGELHAFLNETKQESGKTDAGTFYTSTITTPEIVAQEPYLDWVLEDWDNRGGMLRIGAPQVDEFKQYMDAHNGALPPGTDVSKFTRLNIRRS